MKIGPIPAIMTFAFLLLAFLLLPFFGANVYAMGSLLYIMFGAIGVYLLTAFVLKPPTVGIIAVLAVLLLVGTLSIGGLPQLPSGAVGVQPPDQVQPETSISCRGGETPSVLFSGVDVRTGGSLTESTNIYQLKGQAGWTAWTQGTAITAFVPGFQYVIVPGISTTDFVDNAYGKPFEYTSPCRGQQSVSLYQDATTFTGTFFNANDAVAYASLTASTDATISVKAQAGAKTVFGNPYLADTPLLSDIGTHRRAFPNCACMQVNDTWFDVTDVRSWLSTGQEMQRIATPIILTAATGDTQVCFESPVITDQAIKQYFYLDIAAHTPADDGAIKFYPGNVYLDQYGKLAWGCESDTGAAVGGSAVSVTLDVTS